MAPLLLSVASSVYGAVARQRRAWYTRAPDRQRRLRCPVISVGNLSVGGSGKTPVVAYLGRLLLAAGERPAILSRGYGRRIRDEGVTVVSDGTRVLTDVGHAGDEPLMLARDLPGVVVAVASERYLAGRLAETRLGATVHLLDDGFQHVRLGRDVNLLALHEADLRDHVLPAGRLREPLSAASAADALLLSAATGDDAAESVSALRSLMSLQPKPVFAVRRAVAPVRLVASGTVITPTSVGPVFAVAGMARPERLFTDLSAAGWKVAGTLTFPDHHRYRQADVARIAAAARDARTHVVVTTTKDVVRLEPLDCSSMALAVAPLELAIEPVDAAVDLRSWILERLAATRDRQSATDRCAHVETASR
ncbi:MAG: tetraacyldisaccharide 4'-kinase [Acidimicrobiia bacterium]|nr:tetraacyldisaccharide 4'-kinase [Acidimicrobiia bacterium]